MAAQVLGYVGQVSEKELETSRLPRRSAGHGRRPGRARVLLRPLPARPRRRAARARSTPKAIRCPARLQPTPPTAGHSLQETLDLGLQQEGEKALLEGIENARAGGKPAIAGGVRGDRPAQRRSARDRLLAELRPEQVRQTADRSRIRRARGQDGPAKKSSSRRSPTGRSTAPIRPARRSSRSPRWRRWKAGVINPTEGLGAGSCIERSRRRAVLQLRPHRLRRGGPRRSAEGLLGHLLLRSRRARQQPRQRDPEQGPRARDRPSRPGSTCRASSPARSPSRRGWPNRTRKKRSARANTTAIRCESSPNPASPGPSATTCTSRSARATC